MDKSLVCFCAIVAQVMVAGLAKAESEPIDETTLQNFRRLSKLIQPLQFHRAFATVQRPDWMEKLPEKVINMPLTGLYALFQRKTI